jgi:hypothetical protein
MLLTMKNKTLLVEVEVMAFFVSVAIAAFVLMVGNAMWKSMARESPQNC